MELKMEDDEKGQGKKKGNAAALAWKKHGKHLKTLQNLLKVRFKNQALLRHALIHRSYVNEMNAKVQDNERLEYLGDSVLALVVNEYLYRNYQDYAEGSMAKIKSAAVSEETLARIGRKLNVGRFILMGAGEEKSGGRDRSSIIANTMEAIFGALYVDSGMRATRRCILSLLKSEIERIDQLTYLRDPKSTLQEFFQKKLKERPEYEVIEEVGPDHHKSFVVQLSVTGKEIERGYGSSKRKAEMDAAEKTLRKIDSGELTF